MNTLAQVGSASTHSLALLIIGAVFVCLVLGWDSARWNPTHATHSYLTEWAIDQLKEPFPELQQFRRQIVDGANQELHEHPVRGTKYGVDLNAKRIEHKGTNEGCDDITGWWTDSLIAYQSGDLARSYFLLGIMLHMIQDMGVPAHANKIYHEASLTGLDHFEIMAFSNWKPAFNAINRVDPAYREPWRYYEFSRDWTQADAPDYQSRTQFPRTWTFATPEQRDLLRNRQGRTCHVTQWTLQSAVKGFHSESNGYNAVSQDPGSIQKIRSNATDHTPHGG